jgi:glycosyltransferase involved in cell wall biosynthesis
MSRNIQTISLHIVNDRLIVGGVATILRMVAHEARAQGAACTFWVDEANGALEQETRRLAWGLAGWRKWLTLACSPLPFRLIMAILRDKGQGRHPVLHLNTPYLSTAMATLSAAFWTRTPLVYTVHANKSHISSLYWKLENIIYRCADRMILELHVSQSDYREMNQRKITFIPFGVRQANVAKKWQARATAPFTFIAVNRMDRNRMVDIFIRAFAGQMTGNDSVLHLVGDGADKTELIALADQLGCGQRVAFYAGIDEISIQDMLVEADCFLTLTANGEVGMAGKLAAGVGIPCLAYEFDRQVPVDYSAVSVEQLSLRMGRIAQASDSDLHAHANKTTAALYSSSEDMVSSYMKTYVEVTK